MVVSLKHTTLAVGSYTNDGELTTSEWNEEHALTLGTGNVLGRSTAGTGAVEEISFAALAAAGGFLTDITGQPLSSLSDVTITSIASGELLKWSGSAWINNTIAEAGLAAASHTHTASEVTDFDAEVSNNSSVVANTAKVTNATHTGDVTGDTVLTIAAKAVDVAMLADGTDGELITWDATGVASTVPVGTATHVLTSNGVGAAPTFQAAASGFADPMTTRGDIIYKNAAGTTTRLPAGTSGQVLTSDGTDIAWGAAGSGDALVANPLSQFAATTSAQLAGVISDETGSGALVFGTSPTLGGTPVLPATFTMGANSFIRSGAHSLTLTTTGTTTVTLPTTGTLATVSGALGTPTSLTLTNATGLPLTTGVTGVLPEANLPNASATAEGVVELATVAELNTGTDTTRAVVPDILAGSNYGVAVVPILVFDDSEDVAAAVDTAAGDVFFRVPSVLNGWDLVGVAAAVQTAGTTGTTDIQVRNVTQTADMLSTVLTIDSTETDSSTAAAAAVIDTANDDVATGDRLQIEVNDISTTAPKGLLVELQFRVPT